MSPAPYRRRSRMTGTAILAAAAMTLAGCTTANTGTESNGDDGAPATGGGGAGQTSDETFRIGIGIDMDTLDPVQQTTTTVQNVVDYAVEGLVTFDEDGKVVPKLAESWEFSEDGLTLTMHLRKDVKFQDGTPFNAEAVKFSLARLIDPDMTVPIGGAYQGIESFEVKDEHTIDIKLKNVDPNLVPNLGATMAGIISPTSADKEGNKPDNIVHPVGTGPYTFVEFEKAQQVSFTRFDDYWGENPYYKDVDIMIIPEANSREAALKAGQLDLIMNPPVTDLEAMQAGGDITVIKAPSDRSVYIALNNDKKPLDNVQVRQALNYAVDKEAIVKNVMFDAVNLMDSPFPEVLSGYCEVGAYNYDPDKAKSLLAESGVEDVSITIGTPTGRYLQDKQATQAIAGFLREVGVDVTVKTTDWPTYVSDIVDPDGPYDAHLLGWAPSALDAPVQLQMLTEGGFPPDGLNGSFYSNPEVEDLFSQAKVELDEAKRNDLYCQIQKQIWEDAPWIFLWSQTLSLAHSNDVAGISFQPNEKFVTVGAHPAG